MLTYCVVACARDLDTEQNWAKPSKYSMSVRMWNIQPDGPEGPLIIALECG